MVTPAGHGDVTENLQVLRERVEDLIQEVDGAARDKVELFGALLAALTMPGEPVARRLELAGEVLLALRDEPAAVTSVGLELLDIAREL